MRYGLSTDFSPASLAVHGEIHGGSCTSELSIKSRVWFRPSNLFCASPSSSSSVSTFDVWWLWLWILRVSFFFSIFALLLEIGNFIFAQWWKKHYLLIGCRWLCSSLAFTHLHILFHSIHTWNRTHVTVGKGFWWTNAVCFNTVYDSVKAMRSEGSILLRSLCSWFCCSRFYA